MRGDRGWGWGRGLFLIISVLLRVVLLWILRFGGDLYRGIVVTGYSRYSLVDTVMVIRNVLPYTVNTNIG